MMLLTGTLRVALVTTHLALADVPKAITRERLRATLRIVHGSGAALQFGAPRIACSASIRTPAKSGHLGREEIDVIEPVIAELRAEGLDVRGPVPADTAFTPQFLAPST
jgi:4-hydroxythreonine-4-phosphate dehydrogenase